VAPRSSAVFVCGNFNHSWNRRKGIVDDYAHDCLPRVQIFRDEAHRPTFGGRSDYQRIPESDLRLVFNSKRCRNIDQSVLDAPTRALLITARAETFNL
jgi:hypothetical protein